MELWPFAAKDNEQLYDRAHARLRRDTGDPSRKFISKRFGPTARPAEQSAIGITVPEI